MSDARVGATPELVNLALAVLARRGLVTVYPRRILGASPP